MAPYRPISLHHTVPPHPPPQPSSTPLLTHRPFSLHHHDYSHSSTPPCCFMPFSSLTCSSPRCGDTCHLPTISTWYVCYFSVHLHAAASPCAPAGSSMQSLQCNSIPSQHGTPISCQALSHTFLTLMQSYTLCMPLPDALLAHHTNTPPPSITRHQDHLLQPYNPTTSPCLPVTPALLHQSQTLYSHKASPGLRILPTSPPHAQMLFFKGNQQLVSISLPHHNS